MAEEQQASPETQKMMQDAGPAGQPSADKPAVEQPATPPTATPTSPPSPAPESKSDQPKSSKLWLIILVVVVLLAALGGGGWYMWQQVNSGSNFGPENAVPMEAVSPTPTMTPEENELNQLDLDTSGVDAEMEQIQSDVNQL